MWIYEIRNIENNKRYIGQTSFKKPTYRWQVGHLSKLRKNKHPNEKLQFAWNKYGESSFQFFVLETCSSKNELADRESYYCMLYDTYNDGYNIRSAGRVELMNESTKRKISDAQRRYQSTRTSHDKKMSAKHASNSRTKETINQAAEKLRNLYKSESYKDKWKISASSDWKVTNPEQITYLVTNLSDFCKSHHLEYSCMVRTSTGERKHHKGWSCKKL